MLKPTAVFSFLFNFLKKINNTVISPLHTVERRKATIGTLMNGENRILHFVAVNATIKKPDKEIPGFKNQLMFADATAKSLGGVR